MVSSVKRRLAAFFALALLVGSMATGLGYARSGLAGRGQTQVQRPASNCSRTSVGFTPLMDLGTRTYHGYPGGLYPGGLNVPPPDYAQEGRAHAAQIVPRNSVGAPDPNGKIVLLSIGMSNTTLEFSEFKREADPDLQKNPKLTLVDGAQGGQDAEIIRDPNAQFWTNVTQRLTSAGVTESQVQAIWLKEAVASETRAFPYDSKELRAALHDIVRIIETRYPNIQIVYLASRIYAGYATSALNPEPYAYESGFGVKWLIEDRIASDGNAWLAWGPYMWADGLKVRSDGLVWPCADFQSDGTHPSTSGQQKVAQMLLTFFKTNETTTSWFLSPGKLK